MKKVLYVRLSMNGGPKLERYVSVSGMILLCVGQFSKMLRNRGIQDGCSE